jgi:membrane protein
MPIAWKQVLQRTVVDISEGDCFGWAAQLAYCFFFALFPTLLFAVSLASVLPVQNSIDRGVRLLSRIAPGDVLSIAREQLVAASEEPRLLLVLVSFAMALWSATAGMAAIINTLNQTRRIREGRSWWRVQVTAMLLTLGVGISALIALTVVVLSPAFARWPAAFALVVAAIAVVYRFAPDTKGKRVWMSPGSVMAAVLWLGISMAFKWFVSHFGRYEEIYGAIGGVMVLLSWFYLSGLAILMGAHFDMALRQEARSHD